MGAQVEITIPAEMWTGRDAEEAVVVNWFKREGSPVKEGEVVAEVMIEKVTLEVTAPAAGRIARILIPQNGVVRPGETLAEIAPAEETESATSAERPQAAAPTPVEGKRFVLASPAAKRLARELGVDLQLVQPETPGGRITEADVRRFHERMGEAPEYDLVPLVGIRKITAQRMMESLRQTAQLTLFTDADVTDLVRVREERKAATPVTFTDLIARAVVMTLPKHPRLNAHLVEEGIRQFRQIHLGVAVALSDGLIVPVVKNAGQLSLVELSAEIKRLADAARAGTLKPGETTGSTFSLSNLGMYGTDFFTPVLNPPEVAILGVGRIVDRLTLVQSVPEARRVIGLSLTIDHQALDGAIGAEFLRDLAARLADPDGLYA